MSRRFHRIFLQATLCIGVPCLAFAQVQPVQSYALNNYVRVLDGQWEGIRYASDGNVYFASSSQSAHHGAAFFKYNPVTQQLTMLTDDITKICGEDPQVNPQGKIHSDIVEANGWLYFTTHFASDLPGAYSSWSGSHLIGYELATGRFRDYGVLYPNYDSYSGIGVDPARNYIYAFLTSEASGQASYMFRIDAITGAKTSLGQVGGQYAACLWLFVDRRGDVWFSVSYENGDLQRVHGDTGQIQVYPNALPPVYLWDQEVIDPNAGDQAGRYIMWMQPLDGDRAVFTYGSQGGMLYMFDSTKPIGSGQEFKNIRHIGYSYIGAALGNNRVFYYQRANRGYGHQGDQTPQGITDFHLLSVSLNPADGYAITDHGLLQDQNGRLVWRVPGMMTDGNSRVFMVGDWWTVAGDLGTLRYRYTNGVEYYDQLPRGEFFAMANVTFGTAVSVAVTPSTATLSQGQTRQFTAAVQNSANQNVTWSVSPAGVGSVSSAGLYTAPAAIGSTQTVSVTATSVADNSKSASATVTLAPPGGTATAQFVTADTTTQGSWKTAYGGDGYNVLGDTASYPSYALVNPAGNSFWTWASPTTDIRGLQQGSGTSRVAATWYAAPSFTVDVNLTDGKVHPVALYCVDWDNSGRTETIDVLDAVTGAVLDTRSVTGFFGGRYLLWNVGGHVVFRFTKTAGSNAVVSGIFFGGVPTAPPPPPPSSNAAQFVKTDLTTQGNWKSGYGAEGFNVLGDTSAYGSFATLTPASQSAWTWVASTSDVRGLQKNAGTDRVAATWYAAGSFTVDVNLTDGKAHQMAIYCLDWESAGRGQTIDILDAGTNAVLDSRTVSGFVNGQYVVWNVTGHVTVRITRTAGNNATISGIFLGGAPVVVGNSAQFVKLDTATQGSWKGVYGTSGYNVLGDVAAYPSYAMVGPAGQSAWTWAASTSDVRGLQKSASSDRVASTWYAAGSFTVDVNLTDGKTHQMAIYCLDWENAGRGQTIDILDAGTNAVLDSRSVSGFLNGQYVVWNVTGHVTVRVTRTAGNNAVISGIFF